jgi:hypothetical protein
MQVFAAKSSKLLRNFFQEEEVAHAENGQLSQLFHLYEFSNNL